MGIQSCANCSVQSLSHVPLCNPMNCSTPGLPVHHRLLELAQTHVHQVSDCRGPASAGSRGYSQDERRWRERERETERDRDREKTHETSLDRAKSVFYFLTTGFIPFHRMFSRYKVLIYDYKGLVLLIIYSISIYN